MVYIYSFTGIFAWKVYQIFFFLTGAMFVGSLYFNKVAFIKVAISICILVIGVVGLNWLMAKLFFGNINDAGTLTNVTIPVGKEEGTIQIPERISDAFNYSIWYIFPAMLWLLAFTRLREKEF